MTQQEERFSVGLFVAERLRELRLDRKLSQPELEQRTGVARTYISRVENGHVTPSLEMLGRLAKGLQVPLAGLFYDGDQSSVTTFRTKTTFGTLTMKTIVHRELSGHLARMPKRKRKLLLKLARHFANGG